jgi:RNA polymerase sigma-70 factor (ECF subfamily)
MSLYYGCETKIVRRVNPYPVASDEELVLRTLMGDTAAYDELVLRFRPGAVLVAEQVLGSRWAAEDVAQDALFQAYRALPTLADPAKFPAWLRAIARHRALRVATGERRSEAAAPELFERPLLGSDAALDPSEAAERNEDRASVRALVAELPRDFHTVLLLHYWEQWPLARIARFLSLPVATVKWRMYRGRKLLLRRLAPASNECKEDVDDPATSQCQ